MLIPLQAVLSVYCHHIHQTPHWLDSYHCNKCKLHTTPYIGSFTAITNAASVIMVTIPTKSYISQYHHNQCNHTH